MRVQLLSDLHLEFHRDGGKAFLKSLDPSGVDVLVLAGDVDVAAGGLLQSLTSICRLYRDSSVVYVAGNHEFYTGVEPLCAALRGIGVTVLRNVRDADGGPILVHAITQKGKGYGPAEESADKLHAVNRFNVVTGERRPFLRQVPDGDVFRPRHLTGIRRDVAQQDPQERGFP